MAMFNSFILLVYQAVFRTLRYTVDDLLHQTGPMTYPMFDGLYMFIPTIYGDFKGIVYYYVLLF